jgi:Uma2 family endonuclease
MTAAQKRISAEQYLVREARAKTRSEFIAGEVYAMVGTTLLHNRLAGNIYASVRGAIAKKPCEAFMTDVKLRVAKLDAFFYPDVMVSCGAQIDQSKLFLTDAQLVIEVLSPSTEKVDRDLKLNAYRKLPSLQEYVLVSQDKRQVELYRRGPDIGWTYLSFARDRVVKLESIGLKLPLNTIYAGTKVV